MSMIATRVTLLASCFVSVFATHCGAGTVTEYFNNYGTNATDIAGLGSAGDGWLGAWGGSTLPDYAPGAGLLYFAPGYSNAGNLLTADSGAAQQGNVTNAANGASRTVSGSGYTGTIWASALANVSGTGKAYIRFDEPRVVGPIYAGIYGTPQGDVGALVNYNLFNTTDTSATARFLAGATHLMLVRIEIGATLTSFALWVDPDLTGGEGGLPAPLYNVSAANNNMIGPTFQDIGVGFFGSGVAGSPLQMDAIRVSNEPDGFIQVTAVPEPTTLALLLAAIGCWGIFRIGKRDRCVGNAPA